MEKSFWIYILVCSNDSYYTGYTTDLERRYQEHLKGINCKYTRSFKPQKLARSWRLEGSKGQALQVEKFIKGLSRAQKEELIAHPSLLLKQFVELQLLT